MWEFCITINGKKHCIPLPVLIPQPIHIPPPENFPPLELATAVLQLVEAIGPTARAPELTNSLREVATSFIRQVQKGLPAGVELRQMPQA